jgi:hypothetical protein
LSSDDGVQVVIQEVLAVAYKLHKHDAVAELGVAGGDLAADDDRRVVEPESSLNMGADGESHHGLDVAPSATEVGSFETHGDVTAFGVDFDLNMEVVARVEPAIVFGGTGKRRLRIGHVHGWFRARPIHGPGVLIGVEAVRD